MKRKNQTVFIRLSAVIFSAILIAAVQNTFINSSGLYPGGAAGLAFLIRRAAEVFIRRSVPYSPINLLLNAFPVYIGFRFLGKKYTLYSCVLIALSSVLTDLLPEFILTEDPLLISIFGGLLHGAAAALCLNAGATTGGTDFIAVYLSERRGTDSFSLILGFNAAVLCIAGALFGWDKALYSILFQYASTAAIRLLYKKYRQSTLLIVTEKPAAVSRSIYAQTGHGATVLQCLGAYENTLRHIVYSVVSAAESKKLICCVRQTDPKAFVNEINTHSLAGRFYLPKED